MFNEPEIIECWVCHQQGDNYSNACLNEDVTVTMKNKSFMLYGKKNAQDDAKDPPKRLRVALITVKRAYEEGKCF